MKKLFFILFFVLILLVNISIPQNANHRQLWIISVNLDEYKGFLKTHPQPFDRIGIKGDRIILQVNANELHILKKANCETTPITRGFLPTSKIGNQPLPSTQSGGLNGEYHSYLETETFLTDLTNQFPDKASLFSIGQSIEGREIWGLKISDNVSTNENEPKIYFMGCHHAREWISVEMPLLFGEYLLKNYSSKQRIKDLVDQTQIYIIPIVNPDGLEFSIHTYRWWRKNRRYIGNFIWGVDLNRNYGYMWGYDDIGSSGNPKSEVYRGTAGFSEPESTAIRDFMLNNPPSGSISFHNYSQLILIPWGYTAEFPDDYNEMYNMAQQMRDLIFAVNGRDYEFGSGATAIYPTNGDTDDWIYGIFKVPSFCIELPALEYDLGGFFTSEEEIRITFDEMLPAMLYFAEYSKDHFTPKTIPQSIPDKDKKNKEKKIK